MQTARRSLGLLSLSIVCLLIAVAALPVSAAERPRFTADDYVIDATIQPAAHTLSARVQVKITALDELSTAAFELHNGLRVTKVLDTAGKPLPAERLTQDSSVRVSLPSGLQKGESTTLTFEYQGVLRLVDDSPVQGLKLADIEEGTSYLLYAGRWFPVVGYGTNRFTATIHVTVPAGYTVVGSGNETAAQAPTEAGKPGTARGRRTETTASPAGDKFTFVWDRPSFPGTLIIGKFTPAPVNAGGLSIIVYFNPNHQALTDTYAEVATREFQFFTLQYGPPMSTTLKLVEIPDGTVPMAWAPEMVALSSRNISPKVAYRVLANAIAHQWWGGSVSPATKDDWWLDDGFARYSEALYIQSVAGELGFEEAVKDMEVGALAYDNIPLARVSTLETFSPEFQSLVTDKGAMILHMLRWVVGDVTFNKILHQFMAQYAGKPASIDQFEKVAEQVYGHDLTWFFTQWLNSTGAPAFKNKYTVLRTAKGFRVVGEISQDLDLFRMPLELKIDTDGKSEIKRIEVSGTNSPYSIDTFGRPRKVIIDPDNRVLENSPELKVRTSILRGQQMVEEGDLPEALKEFQTALEANKNSSLAHYRIAEVFFLQRNYQAAANEYRESLNGDNDPKWTEVWSHIQLGKIFDLTGQRARAVNEYRQAVQTNDNTQGAIDEARRYLEKPFERQKSNG